MAMPTDQVQVPEYPKPTKYEQIAVVSPTWTPVGGTMFRTYDPELKVYVYSICKAGGIAMTCIPRSQTALATVPDEPEEE
ncbi:MAG: hypothetical protein ABII76_08735 [Pseudomonadota bacterium]